MNRETASKVGYKDSKNGVTDSCFSCSHRDSERPNKWVKWCALHNCRVACHKRCKFFKKWYIESDNKRN